MLKAGAKGVFWLRAMTEFLEQGMSELLGNIEARYGKGMPIICESNSLRNVLEPGLFFVINRAGNKKVKESCERVKHMADKEITLISNQEGFDFDINSIFYSGNIWRFYG